MRRRMRNELSVGHFMRWVVESKRSPTRRYYSQNQSAVSDFFQGFGMADRNTFWLAVGVGAVVAFWMMRLA